MRKDQQHQKSASNTASFFLMFAINKTYRGFTSHMLSLYQDSTKVQRPTIQTEEDRQIHIILEV